MSLGGRLYDAALHAARPLVSLAGLVSPKVGRAAAGRRTAASSLEAWSRSGRRESLPLIWLHGASAGELAGTAPLIRRLREERELQLAVTFSSPSAEGAAGSLAPDVAEFVPLDTRRDTGRALRGLRPDCLVYAKGDVWPGLTASAERAGVPTALVNATVREGSSRLGAVGRRLLGPAYRRLDAVGAATRGDAARLQRLGVWPERIRVTGDAALDEALERMAGAGESEARRRLERWRPEGAPLLLGGSTWPADEDLLLEASAALRARGREPALVLVPHEPDDEAVERLSERARRVLGAEPEIWSEGGAEPSTAEGTGAAAKGTATPAERTGGTGAAGDGVGTGGRVLVVDVVGILAELYPAADVAHVGGGLGSDGLHSVVEPAAAGVPVTFGPRHGRWEAGRLLDRGAAREVGPDSAAAVLGELLGSPEERAAMGEAAREFVREGAGAADAGAALVAELVYGGTDG